MPIKKPKRRGPPRRKSDAFLQLALKTVKKDLEACSDRVTRMERTLKTLSNEVEGLRDKIRS